MSDPLIEQFKVEQREALLSLDEQKIRAWHRKWNGHELHPDNAVFWGAVHKAITGCRGLPIEFRRASKKYLTERNLRSLDDGDL